jgi:DNA-directed RNA polymerase subunit RPC12/RpoP
MGAMEADLLMHGLAAARSGNQQEAVYYLEWLLRLNPDRDQQVEALFWLSEVAGTQEEARERLEHLLAIDPFDLRARRKLGVLDGKIQPNPNFNPDVYRQPAPDGAQAAEGRRFTCPKCGGRLTYSPDGSSLVCEFCEARQNLEGPTSRAEAAQGSDFLAAMVSGRGHWRPQAELELHCSGCGAVFTLPPAHLSVNCPFCASSHVTREPAQELILPNQIVPFEIDLSEAKESLRGWLSRKFSGEWPRLGRGVGLYLPAWIFHVVGILPWSCEVKRNRDWVTERGDQIVDLDDLRMPATRRLGELLGRALPDYQLKAAQAFAEGYLADWPAETYQVELGDASLEARQLARERMRQRVDERILEQHRNLSVNSTDLMIESFRLVLLPAWLTHYQPPDGKRVELLVNGQTGAVLTSA